MTARYEHLDFFLLRAPAHPGALFLKLTADADVARTQDRLRELAADPAIRRALTVASADLVAALDRLGADLTGKRATRVHSRLLRYLTRMCTRPTPFGAFSGVAIGRFGATTTARLGPQALGGSRVRADMSLLLALIKQLEADEEVRPQLQVTLNSSVFVSGGRAVLPFADVYGQNDDRLISVRATVAVEAAMRLVRTPIPYAQLIAELEAEFPEAGPGQVAGMVGQLWDLNFLTSDLRPPLTAARPEEHLIKRLHGVVPAAGVAATLAESVEVSCRAAVGGTDELVELGRLHQSLVPGLATPTFQLDSMLDLHGGTLTAEVGAAVAEAIDCLMRLTAAVPGHNYHLARYREAFTDRYGANALVPVLEVLDPDRGLDAPPTYTAPPRTYPLPTMTRPVDTSAADRVLAEFAAEAWWSGAREVQLTDAWLDRLAPGPTDPRLALYPTLDAYVQLQVHGNVDDGDWRVVLRDEALAFGGRTYGRFFDLLPEHQVAELRDYARREEQLNPEVAYAEMAYLPSVGRATNVALRPQIREYEIPLNTTPAVSTENLLTLDDIYLGAAENRLYLWSKRLGREVAVTQTHMLSPQVAPNVARFLLEVSNDGYVMPGGFGWGPLTSMPFLPRIARGRAVLRPAQWTVRQSQLAALDPDATVALACWRERWRVPRYVYLTEDDNRLLIDLDHRMGAAELLDEVRKGPGQVTVQEMLPAFGEQWLANTGGATYLDEIVVPLIVRRPEDVVRTPLPPTVQSTTELPRLHLPGQRWAYLKLYSTYPQHDAIIGGPLRDLVADLRHEGLLDRWFYLRYGDPAPHLRIRLRAASDDAAPALLLRLMAWARGVVDAGSGAAFTVDSYRPEIDRYGGPHTFDAVERFFWANSDTTAGLVALLGAGHGLDPELVAVAAVDALYEQFGVDVAERSRLMPRGDDSAEARRRYREHRAYLCELLMPWDRRPDERGRAHRALLRPVLDAQAEAAAEAARAVAEADAVGLLAGGYATVLGSLAHMQINRLMPVDLGREARCYAIWRQVLRSLRGRPTG
ncbi:lantibiotic dehydratase [Micromonospora sp. DT53]|uniref:lantibiotic dehydratase n=1 Tax=Micromonospora sp. DT53 TaxID=3393444 RepID=UPI003CEC322B